MSTSSFPIYTDIQEGIISANLNSSMLLNFLMGMYTMVYGGTMYLYLTKKAAALNRRIVLSAISVLYLLCLANFILEWYFLYWEVVINGQTQKSIFLSTLEGGPQWMLSLNTFSFYTSVLVSDGLLIWRCYHIWGQSFRVISVPFVLCLAELGLSVAVTVLRAVLGAITSVSEANRFNNISSALTLVSLGTTLITTFLIGYRVHSATRLNGPPSQTLFHRIVILVIESAAAYSLVLLLEAIITVVPSFTVVESPTIRATYYIGIMMTIVSGLAPTVLVARIVVTSSNNTVSSTINHISGLQFGSQPGATTRDTVPAPICEIKISSTLGDTRV